MQVKIDSPKYTFITFNCGGCFQSFVLLIYLITLSAYYMGSVVMALLVLLLLGLWQFCFQDQSIQLCFPCLHGTPL